MKPAPIPENEAGRLAALRRYEVLDTPPERVFDDIAALAAHICGAPIALVSLVDAERQWFKARVGVDATETARDISFCGHGILEGDLFVVPDALADERFADNPLVLQDPQVRFYAGSRLVTPDGHAVGMLCVIDRQPRRLTSEQEEALRALGRQVVDQLELRATIGELRKTLGELAESETSYWDMVESSTDFVFTHDLAGGILSANRAFLRLAGVERASELAGRSIVDFIVPPNRHLFADYLQTIRADGRAEGLMTVETAEGERVLEYRNVLRSAAEGATLVRGFARDVTERLRVQHAVERSEERLRKIFEEAPIGMAIVGLDGRFLQVNAAFCRMLGYGAEELTLRTFGDVTHPDDLEAALETGARLFRGEVPSYTLEKRYLTKAGETVWGRITVSALRDERGSVTHALGMIEDVTEHRRSAQQLKERTAHLDALLREIPLAVVVLDPEQRIQMCNAAFERLFGYAETEIRGRGLDDLIAPPELREEAARLTGRGLHGETLHETTRRRHRDGTLIEVELHGVPLIVDGRLSGVFAIYQDITERRRAQEAAEQAHGRLQGSVAELERQARDMALVNEMGDMLQSCVALEEAYSVIGEAARRLFPEESGAVYVLAPSRNLVERVTAWGEEPGGERAFGPEDCWALRRGRAHYVERGTAALRCRHLELADDRCSLCVPMMAQGEALGLLHLRAAAPSAGGGGGDATREARHRLALDLADRVGLAVANLRLRETLRHQSIRDPLTTLFNRRYLEEALGRELRRATRRWRPLAIIFFDVDHFKRFNDTFGHEAGDTLLRELGAWLQGRTRVEDVACRWGGEEFAVVLTESDLDAAHVVAEKLREEVQQLEVRHRGQTLGRITLSLGVAVYPRHGTTMEERFRGADAALYRAKAEGRNRVVGAAAAPGPAPISTRQSD